MEGHGPLSGAAVASRVAITSTDYVAATRMGWEVMGIEPEWAGYLRSYGDYGIGKYELSAGSMNSTRTSDRNSSG